MIGEGKIVRYQPIILMLLLLLNACGFQPLYGDNKGQANSTELAKIEISAISERNGQYLRQELVDRMHSHGQQTPAQYVLSVGTIEAKGDQTISKDATVTRSFIRHTAQYILTDKNTGKKILERSLIASNSYNNLFSEFGTLITEDDARMRNLQDLADRITQQISTYLAHPMKQNASPLANNPQDIKTGRKSLIDPTVANMSNWQAR